MAVFYGYTNAILGTQSTINGGPVDYNFAPSGTWRYSGPDTYFVVRENDGATNYNGDPTNEQVSPQEQIGGTWEQTVTINGTARQTIWDYTFTVTDGTTTWRVGVIDVDLNNDNDLSDAGEDGYFLVFPDGMPPADTDLTTGGIVENDASTPHLGLGASVVCFADGTPIDTPNGARPVEDLVAGDAVLTRDNGAQNITWTGSTTVVADGELAPIVVAAGTLGNETELMFSPRHAILIDDWRAEYLFGEAEVLVCAEDLLGLPGVSRRPGGVVSYHHILLPRHELVRAAGLWSESLYPGEMTMSTVSPDASSEIRKLVPDIAGFGPKAARYLRSFEARLLAA